VLWVEVLNGGDGLGPESEEGDEDERTVGEGEVMPRCRLVPAAWKRDRRGIGCRAQCSKIEAQGGTLEGLSVNIDFECAYDRSL
jgi:hypothetical protein